MLPALLNDGVISAHGETCIACGAKADMHNVLGAFCMTHKDNFVREFKTQEDFLYLDVVPDLNLRQHLKDYMTKVRNL